MSAGTLWVQQRKFRCRRDPGLQCFWERRDEIRRCEVKLSVGSVQVVRQEVSPAHVAELDAARCRFQSSQPDRAEEQIPTEHLLAEPDTQRIEEAREPVDDRVIQERHTRGPGQCREDRPFAACFAARLDELRPPLEEGIRLEVRGQEVQAALFVQRRRREGVMREGRGVREVEIDADEQLEPAERRLHLRGVRERNHGIARDHDERPNALRVLRQDVIGEHGRRRPAEDLRIATDA